MVQGMKISIPKRGSSSKSPNRRNKSGTAGSPGSGKRAFPTTPRSIEK